MIIVFVQLVGAFSGACFREHSRRQSHACAVAGTVQHSAQVLRGGVYENVEVTQECLRVGGGSRGGYFPRQRLL